MATYLDLFSQIALIVGGTQPDPVNQPYFYSGHMTGDGTGVSGLVGCYSVPPETIQDVPMAVVQPGRFNVAQDPLVQGNELQDELIHLQVLVRRSESQWDTATLLPYRDSIPAAFRTHMQLNASPNVLTTYVQSGEAMHMQWGDSIYLGWLFALRVIRNLNVSYTA